MKARLNKRTIDEAEYQGPGGCYLWDTEMTGFGIRIYPTGRKSFVVNYWSRGRRRLACLLIVQPEYRAVEQRQGLSVNASRPE